MGTNGILLHAWGEVELLFGDFYVVLVEYVSNCLLSALLRQVLDYQLLLFIE